MKLYYLIHVSLRSIRRNKFRSALTMLGIVIGVASVVTMVSIGRGATQATQDSISNMGNNLLYVFPGSAASGGRAHGAGTVMTLTAQDGKAIARECPSVLAVSPIVRARKPVIFLDRNWIPNTVEGVGVDYMIVKNLQLAEGRWFTPGEVQTGAKVCVVGKSLVEKLFRFREPIGQTVRIGNTQVEVIGLLERQGSNTWGTDQDDVAMLPWSTVRNHLVSTGFQNVDRLAVSAVSSAAIPRAMEEIQTLLRERHRIREGRADDFNVRDLSQWREMSANMFKILTAFLSTAAGISLLVGGIGIMNIMMVSVTERTREIGVRMAVGARARDILWQFLTESVVLALVGGVVGIALGVAASEVIARVSPWATALSPLSMALAIGFSSAIGIGFGFYPAWRASRLDPIECLRYE